jgi:hypothetical protein
MRLCSDDENDPGYAPWQDVTSQGKIAVVFLDGELVKSCSMADEECGTVRRAVLDSQGIIQIHPLKEDEIWVEVVAGDVKIVLEDRK